MPTKFDWQAEDDNSWDEYASPDKPADSKIKGSRRWPLLLLGLVLITSLALLGFRELRQRVDAATSRVEDDILSSHELVLQAADQSDPGLLASFLSSRDAGWTSTQLALADQGLLINRSPLGLVLRSEETPIVEVEVAPNLTEAEVVSKYVFQIEVGNGLVDTVSLSQTANYQLRDDRWLLSAPDSDFWGDLIASSGRFLTLTFPERDQEIGMRLASDLEGSLAAACGLIIGLACNEQIHLEIFLDTDPSALLALAEPASLLENGQSLILPAPTLVGKPEDEAGYKALYRGYAHLALTKLVTEVLGWQCCQQAIFFQALMDVHLQRLGIRPWPLTKVIYQHALEQPFGLAQVGELWKSDESLEDALKRPDWWLAYALVEFLISDGSSLSAIEILQNLDRAPDFFNWLGLVADQANPTMEDAWQRFMRQKIIAAQGNPPVPLPEQDILLVCNRNDHNGASLNRYVASTSDWTNDVDGRNFVVMDELPNDVGVLLVEQTLQNDLLHTLLLIDGNEVLVESGSNFLSTSGSADPSGRYLSLITYEDGMESIRHYLLDLNECSPAGCNLIPLEGQPYWSQDRSHTLLTKGLQEKLIFLGDGIGRSLEELGAGENPFWLTNDAYGYLQPVPDPEIVLVGIEGNPDPVALNLDELIVANIPEANDNAGFGEMIVTQVAVQPVEPHYLFISAIDQSSMMGYLYMYDWRIEELFMVVESENPLNRIASSSFSSDGRWLAIKKSNQPFSSSFMSSDLILFDTDTKVSKSIVVDDTMVFPIEDWSIDGSWLLQLGKGFLILTEPESMHQRLIEHDFVDCSGAVWVNSLE